MAATVVFGVVALSRIGISQFPDVDFPVISVSLTWEGAAPEVMEHDVVEIVEEAVVQVEGVRTITSSSRQSAASISVELDLSRDVDLAMQDIQAKVAQVQRRLPKDVEPPVISKTNPEDQPIMWVGLSGAFPQQLLSDTARYVLKEKLQTIPGVGEIMMGGYLERNVRIWIDATKLDERNLTVSEVLEALRREHVELPAGYLKTEGREVTVRVLGEALDLATLRQIVLRENEGSTIYLKDVALVEDGFEDERRLARVNGSPAQGLGIKKQRGSNAVAVAKGVREVLVEVQKTLPDGMSAGVNFDSTQFIEESVHEIQFELILSVLLTGLICWLFLGSLSSTLNVILAIPMSLFGTVAVIYFLGYTLNTFTLLALALSVGIVVDDAIMVLENIVRHAEGGKDRVRAAREGTHEITFAALAATLAVIAIFVPVIFMKGVVGKFFMQFGVTLSVAVLLSYVEAITLAPARCAQMLRTKKADRNWLSRKVTQGFDRLSQRYTWVLKLGLRRPLSVLAVATLVLMGSAGIMQKLKGEFVPSQDQSRLMVRLQTAVGSDLGEIDRLVRKAEAFITSRPEVERVFALAGGFGGASAINTGMLFLTLKPPEARELSQNEFADVIRREFNSYPGLKAVVQDLSQSGFTAQRGFPVEFSVQGPDWDTLVRLSEMAMQQLRQTGAVIDLDSDYELGIPELQITPDRARAADLGISAQDIALTLNALVGGVQAGKYSTGGRRIDVWLRLLAEQRARPEDIDRLHVKNRNGELVPLSAVVTQKEEPALQSITRRDRERAIAVFANIAKGHSQSEVLARVERFSKTLPDGYRLVLSGQSMAFQESMGGLWFALILGIIVSYMVLVSQFNSLVYPLTVLSILPLSAAGAVISLWIMGHTINIFSMIGILLLMGIVKKNSIILVDYANQAQEAGADAVSAMAQAGPTRLRPIVMTSVATLMAALPPALSLGPGAEIRAPMAVAVIGGIIVATTLSLVVVPAFYVVMDRMKQSVGQGFGRKRA